MTAARALLALNLGSTGLKAASFSLPADTLGDRHAPHELERVVIEVESSGSPTPAEQANRLLDQVVQGLRSLPMSPAVVAHRIVHGGDRPGPEELTKATLAELAALSTLAPLHQPPTLALVRAASRRWPHAQQIGLFDTSWHQTLPEIRRVFPIPYSLYLQGVKRYGFHGLAFQSAMRQIAVIAPSLAKRRIVLAHLGGGSSLSAVLDGCCVNTTMGMTPLDGIPMSTRPGSLDPGVLLHLERELAMSPVEIDRLLWHECGLKGLSGESGDMRRLLASGSVGARRAVSVYVGAVVQAIAAMAACLRGIDALVFSGGIGANSSEIRARVAGELEWLGLRVDPRLNEIGAQEISEPGAAVKSFILVVDESVELAMAAGSVLP